MYCARICDWLFERWNVQSAVRAIFAKIRIKRGKQNHLCVDGRRQFIVNYEPQRGYADRVRVECLKLYVNGLGFRAIERVTGVHHTTVIHWVKQMGETLPDAYAPEQIPVVGELDELETSVRAKNQNLAVDGR